jgi:hypothetical protein
VDLVPLAHLLSPFDLEASDVGLKVLGALSAMPSLPEECLLLQLCLDKHTKENALIKGASAAQVDVVNAASVVPRFGAEEESR